MKNELCELIMYDMERVSVDKMPVVHMVVRHKEKTATCKSYLSKKKYAFGKRDLHNAKKKKKIPPENNDCLDSPKMTYYLYKK